MSVKERLKAFIKYKNISVRKFESLTDLSYGYVNNMRVSIQPDKVTNIATKFPDLNTGWLLTGEGEMIKKTIKNDVKDDDFDKRLCDMFRNEEIFPASVVTKKNELIHSLYEEIGGLKMKITDLEAIKAKHEVQIRDLEQKRVSSA